jgi:hypothetical protein
MTENQGQKKFVEKLCPRCKNIWIEEGLPSTPFNDHLNKIYTPLESVEKKIRVLNISSGLEDEPLSCSLEPISLDDDARYTALSYCWGDANDRADISVNGQNISVTRSLENALRHMRPVNQHTIVWADALCINQQDVAEKSVQVRMMGAIYSKGTHEHIKL